MEQSIMPKETIRWQRLGLEAPTSHLTFTTLTTIPLCIYTFKVGHHSCYQSYSLHSANFNPKGNKSHFMSVILKTQAHWHGSSATDRFGTVIIIPLCSVRCFQDSLTSGRPSRVTVVDAVGMGALRFSMPADGHSNAMA